MKTLSKEEKGPCNNSLLAPATNTAFGPNILSTQSDALLPEGFLRKDVIVNGP